MQALGFDQDVCAGADDGGSAVNPNHRPSACTTAASGSDFAVLREQIFHSWLDTDVEYQLLIGDPIMLTWYSSTNGFNTDHDYIQIECLDIEDCKLPQTLISR
jgi:hypothetical protein